MTTVKRKSKQLGQILIELGMITPEQLEQALEEHRRTPKSIGRVLIDMGMIKEADLVRALAEQVGLEFVDLAEYPIDPTATTLLPEALARRYRAIPIGERDGKLLVAMSDPANVFALDDIRTITDPSVQPRGRDRRRRRARRSRSSPAWTARSRPWPAPPPMRSRAKRSRLEAARRGRPDRQVRQPAHDPGRRRPRLRHPRRADRDGRADPVPHRRRAARGRCARPKNIQGGVISRLKVMADINIAERRIPQDGRIVDEGGRQAARPARRHPADRVRREGRHAHPRQVERAAAAGGPGLPARSPTSSSRSPSRKPYGTILVTGPTGSGKSTTLYATLNILNEDDRNIITVEDPVEYRLAGVNQMQVNPKAGLTFAGRPAVDPARRPRHRPDR